MTLSSAEWNAERQWLAQVVGEVRRQLSRDVDVAERHQEDIRETRRTVWTQASFDPALDADASSDWAQYIEMLQAQKRHLSLDYQKLRRLARLAASPYFARIDFRNLQDGKADEIYIGLFSVTEQGTGRHMVHDWRAPICSVFYDYEVGPCQYVSPDGTVRGELQRKRQYKIEEGELQYLFDCSLKIDDEALQELLGRSADFKLRNIVESIQREQNSVIRDEKHQLLIVQGAAGSGKTSIALHRVAYLLYRNRKNLRADNILIFSPNEIFADYISTLLPELGEANALQTTFQQAVQAMLGELLRPQDMNSQLDYLLSQRGMPGYDDRVYVIKYKGSPAFRKLLANYLGYLQEGNAVEFWDVTCNDCVIMTAREMKRLFYQSYRYLPWHARVDKLRRRVLYLLRPIKKQRTQELLKTLWDDADNAHLSTGELKRLAILKTAAEFHDAESRLDAWATFHPVQVYRQLFSNRKLLAELAEDTDGQADLDLVARETLRGLDSGQLPYEDVPAVLLINGGAQGFPVQDDIKHVVVDEGQDYSLLHYEVLRRLFPRSKFTVLGDLNQSIHPYVNVGDYQELVDLFELNSAMLVTLTRTYRSTREIVEFSHAVLPGGKPAEHVGRVGERPQVIRSESQAQLTQDIARDVCELRDQGARSIAVICRTRVESERVYEVLKGEVDVVLIASEANVYEGGIVVIPAYLAKGLEFDAVIIYNAGQGNYAHDTEQRLLYTACTRALHYLHLHYSGELSPFVAAVPSQLVVSVEAVRSQTHGG